MFSELAPSGVLVFDSNDAGDGQDLADGRALRLLREALPYDAIIRVEGPWGNGESDLSWSVGVVHLPLLGDADVVEPYRNGATIAEAADKCREALG